MREKINNNPLAQVGLIAVLLVVVAYFVMSAMGGEESGSTTTTTSAEVTTPEGSASVTATITTPTVTGIPVEGAPAATAVAGVPEVPAPPLPRPVTRAFAANRTVVLLIVKKGGLEDRITTPAVLSSLDGMEGVSLFVVPANRIARYVAITQGVRVERVPALVVVTPKHLDQGSPTASVSYGIQRPQSIVQAVVDARYDGHSIGYHP